MGRPDYYEFLQISPNAEMETIHRVFRFLASRYHPDNTETGDAEKFSLLRQAYEVLADPAKRAAYDASCKDGTTEPDPLLTSIDFMDSLQGELNRRLALLAILYARRRINSYSPQVSLEEVETRMGIPREYLEFTIWYLSKKGLITRGDDSAFTLTADGVDHVEAQHEKLPVLRGLLTRGARVVPAA